MIFSEKQSIRELASYMSNNDMQLPFRQKASINRQTDASYIRRAVRSKPQRPLRDLIGLSKSSQATDFGRVFVMRSAHDLQRSSRHFALQALVGNLTTIAHGRE